MIKHILVPTDGSEQAGVGVDFAVQTAARFGAVLHALYVLDIKLLEGPFLRDISSSLGQEPFANHQGRIAMILEERGKAALDDVRMRCEKAGVTCKTENVTGLVARTILDKSELADLVIMGRTGEHHQWLDGLLGSTADAVARRTERPLIVTSKPEPRFGRFLVAYDASHHANGALKTAAALAGECGASMDVLAVGGERAEKALNEARTYLEPHGIDVEYTLRDGDPAAVIIERANETGPDLLVMGTYGHNVVRDLLIGSTTAHVLNHAPCPILLAP